MNFFKKISKPFLLSIFLILEAPSFLFSTKPYSENLIKEDLTPTPALQRLLSEMNIPPPLNYQELVGITQEKWLRKAKERWQEEMRFTEKKDIIKPLLEDLGCIHQVNASLKHYDYAVILGATVNGTRPKLIQLVDEYNRGVRFDKVVFLTADWQHDLEREIPAYLNLDQPNLPMKKDWTPPKETPTTEYAITKSLIDQIEFPKGLDPSQFIHIAAKDLTDAKGNPRRANTKDTLISFIKQENIEDKSCLVFSLQPYVGYQDAIVREILPKNCEIETIGRACDDHMNVAIQLDSVARWIYAEGQRRGVN